MNDQAFFHHWDVMRQPLQPPAFGMGSSLLDFSIINEPVFPADQQEKINAFSEVTIVTFMKYRSFILSTQGCSYLNQSVLFGHLVICSHI
uniref:Uncharacterized protein n=1 Tax=Magallana gigas TaxID=29159 RepID=A0A8W8IA74_MAGGI